MNPTSETVGVGSSPRRWLALAGVLSSGAFVLYALHAGWFAFTSKPSRDVPVAIAVTNLAVYLWARVYSRMRFANQVKFLAVFITGQAAVYFSLRLDGFAGDGRPIWTWRWTPTPQETFVNSRKNRLPGSSPLDEPIDLSDVSPFDYPGFRGRDRAGLATAMPLDPNWNASPPKELWRKTIGGGWSSFAIVGDYCVTQEQHGPDEAVVCYAVRNGGEVWSHRDRARFFEVTSDEGPRATPAIHGGNVYSLGATGILNCLDGATGKPRWTVDILEDNGVENCLFGMTGSPLIVGSLVVVCPGGKGCSLAAYDARSGRRQWRGGDAAASYSSPQFAKLGGAEQILNFNAEGLFAHAADDGRVLWSTPWISNPAERNNVCQPVICGGESGEANRVFISSGYDRGSALIEIEKQGEKFKPRTLWQSRQLKAKFSSVVKHGEFIYGLDNAILTCLDLATGARKWKGGRYGYGQLLLAGDYLVVQLESGEIALVEATPQTFRKVARFDALPGRTWNHPALAGRLLIVRNDREAACFELPSKVDP